METEMEITSKYAHPFEKLGEDVLLEIMTGMDAVSLVNFLSSSQYLRKYRWKLSIASRIVPYEECIKTKNWNEGLCVSAKNNNIIQLFWFINKGADSWDDALKATFGSQNTHFIEFFLHRGAKVETAIQAAALLGDLTLVHHLIKTYKSDFNDWDRIMLDAAQEGQEEFVESLYMQAKHNSSLSSKCLSAVCAVGNLELVNDYCISYPNCILTEAMYWAGFGGHVDLVSFLLKKCTQQGVALDRAHHVNECLAGAARGGQIRLVASLLKRPGCTLNLEKAITEAAIGKQSDMITFLVQLGADTDLAASSALEKSNIDVLYYLLEHPTVSLDYMLKQAAKKGDGPLVDLLIDKGATDFTGALHFAARGRHYDLVDYFILRGANVKKAAKALATEGNTEILDYFIINGLGDFTEELIEVNRYKPYPIAKVSVNKTIPEEF